MTLACVHTSVNTMSTLNTSPSANASTTMPKIDGRYVVELDGGKLLGAVRINDAATVVLGTDYKQVYAFLRSVPASLLAAVVEDLRGAV